MPLDDGAATTLGNALLSQLFDLTIPEQRRIAGAAGLNAARIPRDNSQAVVTPAIQILFGELSLEQKNRALPILAEQIMRRHAERGFNGLAEQVGVLIRQHGYRFENDRFIPDSLDERERQFLPSDSFKEIADAFERLANGDNSGAITKACGAVDSLTTSLYQSHGWGSSDGSFQSKVNTAFKRLEVYDRMKQEFMELGIPENDATPLVEHIKDATNQAVHALQILRKRMGDVHGTKPALRTTAYDSIKWAAAICGLLKEEP
jgi:hypothetical protein